MAQVRVPAPPAVAPAGLRLRMAEIVEGAVIAILLVATVVFGYQWNQAQSALNGAQADLASGAAVNLYAGTYLGGAEPVGTAVRALDAAVGSGDSNAIQLAMADVRGGAQLLQAQVIAAETPAAVAGPNAQLMLGLDQIMAGTADIQAAIETGDSAALYAAEAGVEQGWSHVDSGRADLLTMLRTGA